MTNAVKHLRGTSDDVVATRHLSRLRLNQRGEQLISGGTSTTLTRQGQAVAARAQQAHHTVTEQHDVQERGDQAVRAIVRVERDAAVRGGRGLVRGRRRFAGAVARRAFGTPRDGRAAIRRQRSSKAVRGGLLAQQQRYRAARKAAAGDGSGVARIIGTSLPRFAALTSRLAGAAVTLVRVALTAAVSAFTSSPLLMTAVTVIGLVMAVLVTISWILPEGANSPVIVPGGGWANPVLGAITSGFGLRAHPISGGYSMHDGTDIGAPNGTPVNAACSGIVAAAGPATGGGAHFVVIDCEGGVRTKYGHMDSQTVNKGDSVGAGQQVGTVGTQGFSTGNHLHFIVEDNGTATDPMRFLADRGITLGRTPLEQIAGGGPPAVSGPAGGTAKEYARTALRNDAEYRCLEVLWTRESNWNHTADNPTSSAYGIPQALPGRKMASAGADWETNPITQVRWGLGYIAQRYGTPCQAWAFWQSKSPHWY